jgi:RNA polymerase sigma factor (sigma-70 family)
MNHLLSVPRYDLSLLEAARGGDQHAMCSLLALAQPDIRRYARSTCKRADDVDDAVQETLLLLYRRVGTLRTLTSFSGWLLTVVRRECLRMTGKFFGRQTDLAEIEDDLRFAHRSEDDLRIDLCRAIQSLPAHYRETVLLRDIEEMSINEIANALSLTREAVKARLHRARGLIREYLQG